MKIYKNALGIFLAALISQACTDSFEELNTKPDAILVDNVDAGLLGQAYANAQMRATYGAPGGGSGGFQTAQSLFGDLYSMYFANTQVNFDSDRYTQVGGWSNGAWNNFYGLAAPAIKFVEDFSAENNMPLENALAKIWRVEAYHRITDYWGPIIYSQFGNAERTVPYDIQEFIYKDFFKTLDEAVAVLKANAGGSAFTNHDQIYNGSTDKWLLFANSLRLRLAMRIRYVEPDLARSEAEKAVNDGVMMSNDDNAFIETTINSRNPYWTITDWNEFRMSAVMESVLLGYEDPRVAIYFSPTKVFTDDGVGPQYKGLRNGLAKIDINSNLAHQHSDMGVMFLNEGRGGSAAGAPIRIMGSAEVYFLRAEGAIEGWNMGGSAEELYNKGIEMSMTEERIGASMAQVSAYQSSTKTPTALNDAWNTPASTDIPVKFLSTGDKEKQLEQIITQKWLALYPDGWEAWSEIRRTKYPKHYPRLNSDNPDVGVGDQMSRLVFVQGEYDNNNAAVTEAEQFPELVSRGGNKNSTRLWWDAKP